MAKHEKKKFHPAAEIFPLLEGKEFDELVESIKKNGQQVPIQLLNDAIIDGRNRYLACLEAGEEPWFATADLDGMTPLDYVLVLNKDRRHLDPSQRSMVAARVKEYHAAQAKERQGKRNDLKKDIPEKLPECSGDARDKAGEALHVSGRSVDHAAKVIKGGVKELQAAVDSGQASVSAAAKVAELPEQEQRKVVEAAAKHPKGMKKGIAEAAKKLAEEKQPAAPPKISGGTTFNVDEIEAAIEYEAEGQTATAVEERPRPAKGKEVASGAKLVDELMRRHVGYLVRGIDAVAAANGGKGAVHAKANAALDVVIACLKQMRGGAL